MKRSRKKRRRKRKKRRRKRKKESRRKRKKERRRKRKKERRRKRKSKRIRGGRKGSSSYPPINIRLHSSSHQIPIPITHAAPQSCCIPTQKYFSQSPLQTIHPKTPPPSSKTPPFLNTLPPPPPKHHPS